MKKTMISYALLLGLSPFLVQCVASEQDLRGLEMRTRTMDNRLTDLEQLNEAVRGQATSQARLGSELDNLNNRLLQHEGRMDENEHQHRRLREEYRDAQQNLSMRLDNIDISIQETGNRLADRDQHLTTALAEQHAALTELHAALEELETRQERNQRQIQELREQLAEEAARRAEQARRAAEQARREAEERAARREAEERERLAAARQEREPAAAGRGTPREISPEKFKEKVAEGRIDSPGAARETAAPAVAPETATATAPVAAPESRPQAELSPPPAPTPAPAEDDHYSQGVQHLERSDYQQAYMAFAHYLEETPRGERAADARYLLGESLYGQQEYELAILEYQKVIADFRGHDRVPSALLRQGMAFEKLREPTTAAIVYERLLGEFPNSDQAREARKLLDQLN